MLSLLSPQRLVRLAWAWALYFTCGISTSFATVIEFNSTGGTTATNGLHFYIDDSTQIQVRRLNNTGQVYQPATLPPSTNIDNGIFLRANGLIYGPDHNVATFAPTGGMYSTRAITATLPANPSSTGVQQQATSTFGISSGPQVTVVWKYTTPLDFLTAEVTVVIPATYPVNITNPVRYYHAFDTYLGGSDNGCGVRFTDSNGKLVVGTYPPASGTTCPSSTSIPTGVSVVESFRERSGLPFSNYCASGWSSFWVNGSTNCSVLQSAVMSNNIATTYQDTGIGIQYTFIAPGTYTFSYDFVVGSPNVPPYDHLEIRHPGTANLCATNVTVLACTSSTLPCPAANIVSTGTLTGSITNTPSVPAISKTPATFTLGSGSPTTTVSLTGSSPGGTYILDSSGLSTVPLNGTKCWNTTTSSASCSYVISNNACVVGFECLETGLTYNNLTSAPTSRNPLYTQVASTGFKFDVVALQSNGAPSTTYTATSNVTVELFNDTASPQPLCSAYTSPIASQAITFETTDLGRKTLAANFNISNAYRKLRCRVRDNNLTPVVYGCSSDNFSIRPNSIAVTSSNAAADVANASSNKNENATPVFKAGENFSLTASTNTVGYDGTPLIATPVNSNKSDVFSWANGAVPTSPLDYLSPSDYWDRVVGVVTGTFSAANALTGNATGSAFQYSEVGYFRFQANGIYDSTFTAIDQPNDCNAGFAAGGGKNACNIGHGARTVFFGRFIPDHFTITPVTTMPACSNAFTYFGQDGLNTTFTIQAQNSANQVTQNYTNNAANEGEYYGKLNLSAPNDFYFSASSLPVGATLTSNITSSTSWIRGMATVTAQHLISRPTNATAPTSITILAKPVDSDAVTMPASVAVGTAGVFRYGRLFMPNTYGSELLPLSASIEAQYWNGTAYQRNQLDSCSTIPTVSVAMGNYKSNLSTCETALTGGGTMSAGKTGVKLSAPGNSNNGSVDLTVNLDSASGSTCTPVATSATSANIPWFGTTNPSARSTFGIFKTPVIYMRENF